jgi:hypothetical protein
MVYQYKNTSNTLPKGSGALIVELWIGTMALQNLQQYGCQAGNKLKRTGNRKIHCQNISFRELVGKENKQYFINLWPH